MLTLLKEEADLISSALTVTRERFEAINFIPPVGIETYGIFISKSGSKEELSWISFLLPFSNILWLALLMNSLVAVLFMKTLQKLLHGTRNRERNLLQISGELISNYWVMCCTYLGRKPATFPTDKEGSNVFKVITFVVLFCGNVIFMAYRASLTSELSTRRAKLPFHNLQGFQDSDYRFGLRIFFLVSLHDI